MGAFWIRPEPAERVQLGMDSQKLRTYPSPRAAAEAVRQQLTGFHVWDGATDVMTPRGLEKWKTEGRYGRPKARAKADELRAGAEVLST